METLAMSGQERERLKIRAGVAGEELTLVAAAGLMGVCYRQSKRIWRRYQDQGDAGLVHRLRGKASVRRKPSELREAVLALCDEERYVGFGPTLMAEQLGKAGLVVDHETVRRWRMADGKHTVRRRKQQHRQWRERKPCFGEMVQLDGSHHDGFEGRGPKCVLMVMVDDATNRMSARFFEEETTRASYDALEGWVKKHGLLGSLYVDRDSIYRCAGQPSIAEQLAGKAPQTQFGRAAAQPLDAHRNQPGNLNEVLSWEEERVVQGDWTVTCQGRGYQLDKQHEAMSLVRRKVIVRTLRNGRMQLVYRGQPLKWRALPEGGVRKPMPGMQAKAARKEKPKMAEQTPAKNHPWRRDGVGMGRRFWNGIKAQGRAVRLAVRDSGRPALRSGLPTSRTASRRSRTTLNSQGDILS